MNSALRFLIIGILINKIHCGLSFSPFVSPNIVFVSFSILISMIRQVKKAKSGNCPPQPDPSDLPSPLPIAISNALDEIGRLSANVLDDNTIVK